MSNVVVMRGLPASGKSTFARTLCEEAGFFRLNMDDTRAQLGFGNGTGLWTREKEAVAFDLMLANLVQLVRANQDVVVDNTHIRKDWLLRYKKALRFENVQFQIADFTGVPIGTCLERNALRAEGERVPEDAIRKMAKTLQGQAKPVSGEWMNEGVGLPHIEPYVPDTTKPKAILVDLDGTLYLHQGRSPYDYSLVETDKANPAVLEVIKLFHNAGYFILLASGRPESAREATRRALARDGVPYVNRHFWMRPTGVSEADLLVKLKIFNDNIRDKFNVVFSLDDRDQVIHLYRRLLKVPTFQVNDGNF